MKRNELSKVILERIAKFQNMVATYDFDFATYAGNGVSETGKTDHFINCVCPRFFEETEDMGMVEYATSVVNEILSAQRYISAEIEPNYNGDDDDEVLILKASSTLLNGKTMYFKAGEVVESRNLTLVIDIHITDSEQVW